MQEIKCILLDRNSGLGSSVGQRWVCVGPAPFDTSKNVWCLEPQTGGGAGLPMLFVPNTGCGGPGK